jgi:lipopolysaccharide transport system ATP-binding protein
MSKTAIRVEHLGKKYRIGARQRMNRTLRETLMDTALAPIRRLRGIGSDSQNTIWALDDVSFVVKHGEAIGIIGRNGAGKSTLLKILSRITWPTRGRVELNGRVGSLLEVGTGFHHELTGRENIYLNGAILGMSRREIKQKFDEIVAFSGIEKFLDTQVKFYSSGMYVRLAFAVAAHLEPEILLVDEVLAVGDAEFQKKCLGKMGEVAREGRTVLFVSHNMTAIQAFCSRAVLLFSGKIAMDGGSASVVSNYLSGFRNDDHAISVGDLPRIHGGNDFRLTGVKILSDDYQPATFFEYGSEFIIQFTVRVLHRSHRFFSIEWSIYTDMGVCVLYCSTSPQHSTLIKPNAEIVEVECRIPALPLTSGRYSVNCLLSVPHQERLDEVEGIAKFEVVRCDPWNTGFNLRNSRALTTTENQWRILDDRGELVKSGSEDLVRGRPST